MQGLGDVNGRSTCEERGTELLQTIEPVTRSKMAIGASVSRGAPVEK